MVVRIHQTRKHRQVGQVDHLGAGRDRDISPNGSDAAAVNQNDLVGSRGACLRVDELARPDGG